jgi:hypothetical protein
LDKRDLQNPNSFEELGYIYIGPMVFNFFMWLKLEITNCDLILFNSREGYFFKEIYEIFKNKYNLPESVYFKTSRKLAAIASFKTKDDIYKTFELHRFSGKLSNLLENRFGLKVNIADDKIIDTSVEIPNLDEYIDDILLEAKNTRDEYLKYIQSVVGDSINVIMVDSGFQGMTQHNIQKAYDLKFKGRYFIYKGNPFLDDVKGFYHFEESNLRKNLIFFESIFIDKIGSYINIKNGEFINEEYDKSLQHFDEKTEIINGVNDTGIISAFAYRPLNEIVLPSLISFNISASNFADISLPHPILTPRQTAISLCKVVFLGSNTSRPIFLQ